MEGFWHSFGFAVIHRVDTAGGFGWHIVASGRCEI